MGSDSGLEVWDIMFVRRNGGRQGIQDTIPASPHTFLGSRMEYKARNEVACTPMSTHVHLQPGEGEGEGVGGGGGGQMGGWVRPAPP